MKWFSVVFFLFIGFVIISANLKLSWVKYFASIPYSDKIGHFCLVGGFAFFANIFAQLRTIKLFNRNFLLGSIFVLVFMTFEEFSQIFIEARTFDLIDLLCNYLGIFTIGYLAKFVPMTLITQKKSSLSV